MFGHGYEKLIKWDQVCRRIILSWFASRTDHFRLEASYCPQLDRQNLNARPLHPIENAELTLRIEQKELRLSIDPMALTDPKLNNAFMQSTATIALIARTA